MFHGQLDAIFIGPARGEPMKPVETARAIAGVGLDGDRYARGDGTFSVDKSNRPNKHYPADRQVTLIEAEAIEAAAEDCDAAIEPCQSRRNLLVRGVPLNHLVGKEFLVGPVRLRGLRLCEPCGHLEKLTAAGVKSALLHRGGLRAEILQGGDLRVGDPVGPPA